MLTLEKIQKVLIEHKGDWKDKYCIKRMGVFGSYVRGDQMEGSDVDILVEFEEEARISLMDFVGLEIEISDLLGTKVDLVEIKNLKPNIGKYILHEVIFS
jgi:predicted nucleotidyltransferase